MSAIDVDSAAAHEAARHELAKPIYPATSIPQRIREWIHELLYRIIEQGSAVPGGWLTITVLVMALAAGVVVAVRIVRRTIRTHTDTDHRQFDDGQLTAAQHRAIAEQSAAEGNWAAAIRHRLRAVARSLEEAGVLDPAPGRTANELAAVAGERLPALAAAMSHAVAAFNDVTYGDRPGTEPAYQLIVDLDDHAHYLLATGQFVAPATQIADSWSPLR